MVLWQLFKTFFWIGLVSFGGGYAMIPIINSEVTRYGWIPAKQFTNLIAISGMSPGPIATNSAILVGYSTSGIAGAIISAIAILIPSIILVILIASFFKRMHDNHFVQSLFYGLKPIVTSLIIYASISFALSNDLLTFHISFRMVSLLVIFGLSLFVLIKYRWHPLYVIILSGLVGVALYS
ncbi:chromate transporter [Paenibacillus sp. BSR1-1]|uniref:chromate transporter n=1 Tax=Paenibacillus sp. BSR1-1 TaxID=3020845 RepID=UPI0025AFE1BC|nr:chromate transporter [Paenibacillus sp. BSR1-1]MDN3017231.1 chromate transporter [Paenibacillus sp. BSR1-1]